MKRSDINHLILEASAFFARHRFVLPPFASWTPEDWRARGPEAAEIADHQLGWDITDFGAGRFEELGLLLFTVRNGRIPATDIHSKSYAEKIMIVREKQVTPWHFHHQKMEDIINRGGGELIVALANATPDDKLDESEVEVSLDGVRHKVPGSSEIILRPGESVTLPPRLYHAFWARERGGMVLVGEVSRVNDDHADNRFLNTPGRFPTIEEDEAPLRLLVGDYPRYYAHAGA